MFHVYECDHSNNGRISGDGEFTTIKDAIQCIDNTQSAYRADKYIPSYGFGPYSFFVIDKDSMLVVYSVDADGNEDAMSS